MFNIACSVCQISPASQFASTQQSNEPIQNLNANQNSSAKDQFQQILNQSQRNQQDQQPINFLILDCCFSFMCAECFKKSKNCVACSQEFQNIHFINCQENHMIQSLFNCLKVDQLLASAGKDKSWFNLRGPNDSKTETCNRCNLNESVYHCSNCQVNLCEGCNTHIHSLGVFSKHELKEINKQLISQDGNTHDQQQLQAWQNYQQMLERCDQHPEYQIIYFSTNLNKYGCQQCFNTTTNPSKTYVKIVCNSQQFYSRKIELSKELQTSSSYLQTIIERNNQIAQNELVNKKRQQIQHVNETIERMISCLKLKNQELVVSINNQYNQKLQKLNEINLDVKNKKNIIERNYCLLRNLIHMMPEIMLTVEEQLIKRLSQTNISILEEIQKSHGVGRKSQQQSQIGFLSENQIQKLDDAIRELSVELQVNPPIINYVETNPDRENGSKSYRSPGRDDERFFNLPTKSNGGSLLQNQLGQQKMYASGGNLKKSSALQQFQKNSSQKVRDKSLNSSQNQATPQILKNQTTNPTQINLNLNPDSSRGHEKRETIGSLDLSQPQILKNANSSNAVPTLYSQRALTSDESKTLPNEKSNLGHSINGTMSQVYKQKPLMKQQYKPIQTTTSQTRKNQKQSLQNSNQKQRKLSMEQNSPLLKSQAAFVNNTLQNSSNLTRELSNNRRQAQTNIQSQSSNTNAFNSGNNNYNSISSYKMNTDGAGGQNSNNYQEKFDINDIYTTQQLDEYQQLLDQNPLSKRQFTHIAQTSTAIQVAWSHPTNFSKQIQPQKKQLQYVLQYGIGVKVNNTEQFRQIYKGKAHKCIITDLMPRTTYRFRVAPIMIIEQSEDEVNSQPAIEQGEWSEISNIATKDNQIFTDQSPVSINPCATIVTKGKTKCLNFDKAGTILSSYGYSFGEHLWQLKISYLQNTQSINNNPLQSISNTSGTPSDQGGIMIVGIINKRFSNSKMIGSVINYSIMKGSMKVRILLDANKKKLIIFTPNNPQGEIFTDLPKDGLFYPAIQNKTKIQQKNLLKVDFKFELLVPKDRQTIPNINYSSSEDNDHLSNDNDNALNNSDYENSDNRDSLYQPRQSNHNNQGRPNKNDHEYDFDDKELQRALNIDQNNAVKNEYTGNTFDIPSNYNTDNQNHQTL